MMPRTEEEWEKRLKLADENQAKLKGKVSLRVELLLARVYLYDGFTTPIDKATDVELLALRGVGINTLAEIRRVFPEPETIELVLKSEHCEERVEISAELWQEFEKRAAELKITPEELFPKVIEYFINLPDAAEKIAQYLPER